MIAVIAILAAVLIPTFATVIKKANDNKAMQQARNANTEYIAELGKDIKADADYVIVSDGYIFIVTDCQMNVTHAATGVKATSGTDANNSNHQYYTLSAGTANSATGAPSFSSGTYDLVGDYNGAKVYVSYTVVSNS